MRRIAAIVLALIVCEGCATTPQRTPVTPQTQRNFNGFSIEPPQGLNWVVNSLRDDTVSFEKMSPSHKCRVIVGVERSPVAQSFTTPEDYLQYIKSTYFVADPRYYQFSERKAELSTRYGPFCAKTYYSYKDTMMSRPSDIPYVIHEGRCYVCLHPEDRDYEYEICRSEEYAPGHKDSQLAAEEEDFIEKFAFSRLVKVSRIYILQQYPAQLFPTVVKVDDKKIAQLSQCGEVAIVEASPGEHTISAAFSVTVVNMPTRRFSAADGKSNFFIVRERDWEGNLLSRITLFEVPERGWLDAARAGLADPSCR